MFGMHVAIPAVLSPVILKSSRQAKKLFFLVVLSTRVLCNLSECGDGSGRVQAWVYYTACSLTIEITEGLVFSRVLIGMKFGEFSQGLERR